MTVCPQMVNGKRERKDQRRRMDMRESELIKLGMQHNFPDQSLHLAPAVHDQRCSGRVRKLIKTAVIEDSMEITSSGRVVLGKGAGRKDRRHGRGPMFLLSRLSKTVSVQRAKRLQFKHFATKEI